MALLIYSISFTNRTSSNFLLRCFRIFFTCINFYWIFERNSLISSLFLVIVLLVVQFLAIKYFFVFHFDPNSMKNFSILFESFINFVRLHFILARTMVLVTRKIIDSIQSSIEILIRKIRLNFIDNWAIEGRSSVMKNETFLLVFNQHIFFNDVIKAKRSSIFTNFNGKQKRQIFIPFLFFWFRKIIIT